RTYFEGKTSRWYLSLWTAPPEDPFVIDAEKRITGGGLCFLPVGGRMATAIDLSQHDQDRLRRIGANMTVLLEGCQLKIDQMGDVWLRKMGTSRIFNHSLVCLPLYPTAASLTFENKLEMVFNFFDER